MALVQRKFVVGDVCFDCWIFKTRDGKFWFKGKDIARFLGYDNPIQSIRTNVAVDWCKNWSDIEVSYGVAHHNWEPKTVFISEPGLYALLSRSKKPKALQFTRWVYEETLPSLRENGACICDSVNPNQLEKFIKMLEEKDQIIKNQISVAKEKDGKFYELVDNNQRLCARILEDKPSLDARSEPNVRVASTRRIILEIQ